MAALEVHQQPVPALQSSVALVLATQQQQQAALAVAAVAAVAALRAATQAAVAAAVAAAAAVQQLHVLLLATNVYQQLYLAGLAVLVALAALEVTNLPFFCNLLMY